MLLQNTPTSTACFLVDKLLEDLLQGNFTFNLHLTVNRQTSANLQLSKMICDFKLAGNFNLHLVAPFGNISTPRSRDGLETYQRLISVSSRPKCPTSRSRTCASRISSRSRPKTSRLASRTNSSCGDVSCRHTQLNYNSPMKTSRPMPYSVGRVLGTVCLDGYCLINNVFTVHYFHILLYSVPRKRLAICYFVRSVNCEINMQCGPEKSKPLLLQ